MTHIIQGTRHLRACFASWYRIEAIERGLILHSSIKHLLALVWASLQALERAGPDFAGAHRPRDLASIDARRHLKAFEPEKWESFAFHLEGRKNRTRDLKNQSDPPFRMAPVGKLGIGLSKKDTTETLAAASALGRLEACRSTDIIVIDTCITQKGY